MSAVISLIGRSPSQGFFKVTLSVRRISVLTDRTALTAPSSRFCSLRGLLRLQASEAGWGGQPGREAGGSAEAVW